MEIYLVQHGLAKTSEDDPERPLTDEGILQTKSLAPAAGKIKGVGGIWHSGKRRAEQTAEILAQFLEPRAEVLLREGLGPNDDPRFIMQQMASLETSVLIVGHLPHLAKLAGLLLCGDETRRPVEMKNSAILCLVGGDGDWAVRWYAVPERE